MSKQTKIKRLKAEIRLLEDWVAELLDRLHHETPVVTLPAGTIELPGPIEARGHVVIRGADGSTRQETTTP